jgi:methionine-S-sulfoxide reductase
MSRTFATFFLLYQLLAGGGAAAASNEAVATFAGGCFWCMEKDFEAVPGVHRAVSGYTGGKMKNPTYRNHGRHIEAIRVYYNPRQVSYGRLLEIFWRSIDPTDAGGQFCDRGHAYSTAIFAAGPDQREQAQRSKQALMQSGRLPAPVVTPIRDAGPWTDAEDYHQDYYRKNPLRYKFYRFNCGRDSRLEDLWGDGDGDNHRENRDNEPHA